MVEQTACTWPALRMGYEDFDVNGITCRPMAGFIVKLGINWPKWLQFSVKLHTGEDHEAAARRCRWLATERGQRHSAESRLCDGGGVEEQTDRCDSIHKSAPLLGCVACEDDDCVAQVILFGSKRRQMCVLDP